MSAEIVLEYHVRQAWHLQEGEQTGRLQEGEQTGRLQEGVLTGRLQEGVLTWALSRGSADPGRLQEGVLTGRLQEGVQPRFRTRVCSHELVTARSSARSEPAVIVSDFVHMGRRSVDFAIADNLHTGTYPGADRSDVVSALHDL